MVPFNGASGCAAAPVVQSTRFAPVTNLEAARAPGLDVPPQPLAAPTKRSNDGEGWLAAIQRCPLV